MTDTEFRNAEKLTVSEIAAELRRDEATVRYWLRNKILSGRRIRGQWLITRSQLEKFLAEQA